MNRPHEADTERDLVSVESCKDFPYVKFLSRNKNLEKVFYCMKKD